MGPRKKTKPNPKGEVVGPPQTPETVPLPGSPGATKAPDTTTNEEVFPAKAEAQSNVATKPWDEGANTPNSSKSWYGGRWHRASKASPITQVARETISSAGKAISGAAEAAAAIRPRTPLGSSAVSLRSPSLYLSGKLGSSSRSLPISATTTKVNVSSSNLNKHSETGSRRRSERKVLEGKTPDGKSMQVLSEETNKEESRATDVRPVEENMDDQKPDRGDTGNINVRPQSASADRPANPPESLSNTQSSWLVWFSKNETAPNDPNPAGAEANKVLVGPNNMKPSDLDSNEQNPAKVDKIQKDADSESQKAIPPAQPPLSRSWLPIWNTTASSLVKDTKSPDDNKSATHSESATTAIARDRSQKSHGITGAAQETTVGPPNNDTSSGWAFWSRGNATPVSSEGTSQATLGKLAVAGSQSQSQPENAISDGQGGVLSTKTNLLKRERPESLQASEDIKKPSVGTTNASGNAAVAVQLPTKPELTKSAASVQPTPQNLILPPLKETYHLPNSPGFLEQLTRLLYSAKTLAPKHVSLLEKAAPVKKALAIGVHGYFPAPLLRSVLGQPTGTSIKFSESAASAIQKWTQDRGYSCEVEKIALEGEGKIVERVDLLWKLMLNWIETISKSDFILFACHSQGVPVAIMLVAKLISLGCVHAARIGVCAMAGVNLGPFSDYRSRWIGGSAGELFEFARSNSIVSKDYQHALETVLKFGVKILYIGSIDDQLVSLEVSSSKLDFLSRISTTDHNSQVFNLRYNRASAYF